MNILVTGCAGFIGFHFCNNLLKKFNKIKIFGVDNFNNYYDTNLKKNRVKHLKKKFKDRILINKIDLIERDKLDMISKKIKFVRLLILLHRQVLDIRYKIHQNILEVI